MRESTARSVPGGCFFTAVRENDMENQQKKRIVMIIIAAALWLSSLSVIFIFTSYNADDSRQMSLSVAQRIENVIARFFYVNHNDDFWHITLNDMIRKFGHFAEFSYLGFTTGLLMAVLLKKRWAVFPLSAAICFVTAMTDEYRQRFIPGRGPQWSDVAIDCVGALAGLLVFLLIYAIFLKIRSLKQRIRELENSGAG